MLKRWLLDPGYLKSELLKLSQNIFAGVPTHPGNLESFSCHGNELEIYLFYISSKYSTNLWNKNTFRSKKVVQFAVMDVEANHEPCIIQKGGMHWG